MGIWLNTDIKNFYDVPTYYYVAATKPLEELNAENVLQINQVGIKNLRFEGAEEKEIEERNMWIDGIINSMIISHRYNPKLGKITFLIKDYLKPNLIFLQI